MITFAAAVTFAPMATGQIQILRTGSGFWRWDHGEPFPIDAELLAQILRNTQLRARPLRVDFMHWSNGGWSQELGNLCAAGEVDPCSIVMQPWQDPATNSPEYGLFCPVAWTSAGVEAVHSGLDEISPVIEWEYALPFDVTDPDTGEITPAGTEIGPTITGISVVDQGFFWMDKVRVYAAHGAPKASLYQEYTMLLTPEQLAALITWMTEQGWDEETQNKVIALASGAKEEAPAPEAPPAMPGAADPAAAVMAARNAFIAAIKPGMKPAEVQAVAKKLQAAAKPTTKPATNAHPLSALLASATKARAQAAAKPAVTTASAPAVAPNTSKLEEQLAAQKAITDQLMMKELDREGLLVGIDDPMGLYAAAPDYFIKVVEKNQSLVGSASPAAPVQSGLRAVASKASDENESDETHRKVSTYREAQLKAGRRLSYAQALMEWEQQNPPKKKALL